MRRPWSWRWAYALLFLVIIASGKPRHPLHVSASNWAQVSGTKQTNAVLIEPTPWARRNGHAVAALDFSDEYVRTTGQKARLFVLGGDTDMQGTQDLRSYPGGGGLKNDVWATTGVEFDVHTNILETNKWGDALPQIVSNGTWLQTNSGKLPPKGVTYQEWIACAANAWAVNPVTGCDDPTQPPGAYLADNMFSPRRNFVALSFQNALFVLGGRAREHAPVPEYELRAGVAVIGPRNARWREFAVLKNDVWTSPDAGASWKLVTPGCAMPQQNLVFKGSTAAFQCVSSDDCEGDSSCKWDAKSSTGICVCNMWSPREHHAVAVHNNKLYLSGGYAVVQLGLCGVEENARKREVGEEFACGGGYRAYMNDIWTSADGQTWKLVQLHAEFAPRGEHAMISFQSAMYVLGGRAGDPSDAAMRTLHADVWMSNDDGATWGVVTDQAPWSPRAQHVVLFLPGTKDLASGEDPDDAMLLLFGEDDESVLGDVWTWRGPSHDWIQDYSAGTLTEAYVAADSNVAALRGIKPDHAASLMDHGILTFTDLTQLDFATTIELRASMPICDYIALAREIIATCTITIPSTTADETTVAPTVMTANTWDGCTHLGTPIQDTTKKRLRYVDVNGIDQVQILRYVFDDAQASICKTHPTARSSHAGVVFQRRVWMLGGMTAPDYYENDVWVRDARLPKAQLTKVPISGTSATEFAFTSDKDGCVFEYHVLNVIEQLVVRNWTLCTSPVDVLSWLDGGTYRFRVRAVDAAGNVDAEFESGRNEYEWRYKPKPPYALIIGLSSVLFVLLIGALLEWRKRRKRAAMERYAMKRMRRKLKHEQKAGGGATDEQWRATYDQAKNVKGKDDEEDEDKPKKHKGGKGDDKKTKKKKDKTSKDKKGKKDKKTKKDKTSKKSNKDKHKAKSKSKDKTGKSAKDGHKKKKTK